MLCAHILNPALFSIEFPTSALLLTSIDSTSPRPDHPYDILPLVLTAATQEIFGCIVDVDVTAEKPYKLLDRESIAYDLRTRAAVSDFSPAKQYILVRLIY